MPQPGVVITASLREALEECFHALTNVVRPELRRQLILKTEDVDVVAPADALIDVWEGASAGALGFTLEPDGKIVFDAPQGFRVRVNIIELGGGCIDRIHAAGPLFGGSVASVSDLLLLRAVTVVERGGDGDIADFKWLLSEVARMGQFPTINDEELAWLVAAADLCLGRFGRLVIAAILGEKNEPAALALLGIATID
ncbi:hypothetical protein VTH06DRAFT_7498 [Thermothelomyces fergusii]